MIDLKRKHLQMLTSTGLKITAGTATLFIFAAFWMISSASLNLLRDISHRGDSGINLEFIFNGLYFFTKAGFDTINQKLFPK